MVLPATALVALWPMNMVDFGPPPPRKKRKTTTTKNKNKTKTATNWFEKCTVEQLKALCKAATLPVSGTKATLVDRLLTGDLTQPYAYNEQQSLSVRFTTHRDFETDIIVGHDDSDDSGNSGDGAGRPDDGVSTAALKERCRSNGLLVSGTRFDFVLRLLQKETAAATGIAPTRAAGTFDDATGTFVPKPRQKSMKLPNVERLAARMDKMANPDDRVVNKWSNNMHKYHNQRCVELTNKIIATEIVEKQLMERNEHALAWQVVRAVVKDGWLRTCYDGMGRSDYEMTVLFDSLIVLLDQTTDGTLRQEQERWLRHLHDTARKYAMSATDEFRAALDRIFPSSSFPTRKVASHC